MTNDEWTKLTRGKEIADQAKAARAMLAALADIVASSDANDGGSLANAIEAAREIIAAAQAAGIKAD